MLTPWHDDTNINFAGEPNEIAKDRLEIAITQGKASMASTSTYRPDPENRDLTPDH
jgi:hypothetical protein